MKQRAKASQEKRRQKTANKFLSNNFDPLGSYTGICSDENEIPTQDADDL